MILVDSSVWIDYFKGTATPQTDLVYSLLGREKLAIGDLIVTEVLQGFAREHDVRETLRFFNTLDWIEIGGRDIAVRAALNYRTLRSLGVTVRKTIDCIIATRCIESGHRLLHSDRDFEPFVRHLGLRVV